MFIIFIISEYNDYEILDFQKFHNFIIWNYEIMKNLLLFIIYFIIIMEIMEIQLIFTIISSYASFLTIITMKSCPLHSSAWPPAWPPACPLAWPPAWTPAWTNQGRDQSSWTNPAWDQSSLGQLQLGTYPARRTHLKKSCVVLLAVAWFGFAWFGLAWHV